MSETEVTCPYCKEEFDVDTDEGYHYKDGESQEDTCPYCEKKLMIYSSCSWYREAQAADCLNTGEHQWPEWTKHHPLDDFTKWFATRHCDICGEQQQTTLDVTDDEDEQRRLQMYKDVNAKHHEVRL